MRSDHSCRPVAASASWTWTRRRSAARCAVPVRTYCAGAVSAASRRPTGSASPLSITTQSPEAFDRSVARSAVRPCAISAASGWSPTGENGRITIIGRDPARSGSIAASAGAAVSMSRERWANQTARVARAATRTTTTPIRQRFCMPGRTAGTATTAFAGESPAVRTAAISR